MSSKSTKYSPQPSPQRVPISGSVEAKVIDIFKSTLGVGVVTLYTKLNELDIGSLDTIELIMEIEEHLNTELKI